MWEAVALRHAIERYSGLCCHYMQEAEADARRLVPAVLTSRAVSRLESRKDEQAQGSQGLGINSLRLLERPDTLVEMPPNPLSVSDLSAILRVMRRGVSLRPHVHLLLNSHQPFRGARSYDLVSHSDDAVATVPLPTRHTASEGHAAVEEEWETEATQDENIFRV